jgi:pimeloyl-ACP methyl ester carboxylesterase
MPMNKLTVYFIPGLGADYRLYNNISLPGVECIYIAWPEPNSCTTLQEYTMLLLPMIDTSKPFVLCGTSMGGMVAIELAKHVKPEKLVLISTVKTKNEFPAHLRVMAKTRLHEVLINALKPTLSAMMDLLVSWQSDTQRTLFLEMLNSCTPQYLKFAMDACVAWDNEEMPENYIHLHGTKDPLFPISKLHNVIPIEGGNHFMVYENGKEISEIIRAYLELKN